MMRIDLKSVEPQAGVHDKGNLCNSMGFSTTATTVCHPTDRTVHTMIIQSNQIKKFYLKSVHFITINISSQELFKPTCIINYIS